MIEADAVRILRDHWEGLFPKLCPNCGRRFDSLREYLLGTTPLGPVVSYDAELGHWHPLQPLGILAFSTCPCGTSLALRSTGMPLDRLWSLLGWVRTEMQTLGLTSKELHSALHDEICQQVLAGPAAWEGRRGGWLQPGHQSQVVSEGPGSADRASRGDLFLAAPASPAT